MSEDSTVVRLRQPEEIDDPLTVVLRSGARRLLAQAIEAEAASFLALMADWQLGDGRARFVRHGHGPARTIQTGLGPVEVKRAKRTMEAAAMRLALETTILRRRKRASQCPCRAWSRSTPWVWSPDRVP